MAIEAMMLSGLNSGVVLSLIAVLWTVVWQNLQHLQLQQFFARHLSRHARRLAAMVDPYLSVTISEYEGGRMKRSDAYEEVKAYLSDASARGVRHLRAEGAKDADKLVLSMSDGEEVEDEFQGARVFWGAFSKQPPRRRSAASSASTSWSATARWCSTPTCLASASSAATSWSRTASGSSSPTSPPASGATAGT